MHRTQGEDHASNLFTDGPPGTRVEEDWLNAIQEEIANVIETGGGLALKTAATETRDQLLTAIQTVNSTDFLVEHNATTGTHKLVTIDDIKLDDTGVEELTISDASDGDMAGGVFVKGKVRVNRPAGLSDAFTAKVDADAIPDFGVNCQGDISHGDGTNLHDARYRRTGVKIVEFDDNAGGNLTTFSVKALSNNITYAETTKLLSFSYADVNPDYTNPIKMESLALGCTPSGVGFPDDGSVALSRLPDGVEIDSLTMYGVRAAGGTFTAELYKVAHVGGTGTQISTTITINSGTGNVNGSITNIGETVDHSTYNYSIAVSLEATTVVTEATLIGFKMGIKSSNVKET